MLVVRTSERVQRLQAARGDRRLPAELAKLDRFELIVLDDFSCARRDLAETSVLFELIAERYEPESIAITANAPVSGVGRGLPWLRIQGSDWRSEPDISAWGMEVIGKSTWRLSGRPLMARPAAGCPLEPRVSRHFAVADGRDHNFSLLCLAARTKSLSVVRSVRLCLVQSCAINASIVPSWAPAARHAFRRPAAAMWSSRSG